MASAIDKHPQKQKIIDAIIAGEELRSIAKWVKPPVSHVTIWRFAQNTVTPALRKQGEIAKTLRENEILREAIEKTGDTKEISRVTGEVIAADPILARIEEKRTRVDRILAKAETEKQFSACAALEAADTRTLTLQAQLQGRLQQVSSGTTVQVAVYAPQIHVHQQPEPSNVIDADVCEITR